MKKIPMFGFVVAPLLSFPAVANVTVDFDSEGRFDSYRTFAWAKGTAASDPDQERIVRAVEPELAARSFEKVKEKPDLFVVTHVATRPDQEIDVNDSGYRRRLGLGTVTVSIFHLRVGSLTVDLFDGEKKIPVWRGIAPEAVTDKVDKNEKEDSQSGRCPVQTIFPEV